MTRRHALCSRMCSLHLPLNSVLRCLDRLLPCQRQQFQHRRWSRRAWPLPRVARYVRRRGRFRWHYARNLSQAATTPRHSPFPTRWTRPVSELLIRNLRRLANFCSSTRSCQATRIFPARRAITHNWARVTGCRLVWELERQGSAPNDKPMGHWPQAGASHAMRLRFGILGRASCGSCFTMAGSRSIRPIRLAF